ncbi:putative FAD-binding domain-containing protein [Seiridium cardinale]
MVIVMQPETLDVAIVGGGITGLVLAIGLIHRKINVRVYERASSLREIGAGIGFSPNAEWAMKVVDPRVHAAFKSVATPNASDWFQYVDGQSGMDDLQNLFKVYLGDRGFEGCSRPDYLDALARLMPSECLKFQKNLLSIVDSPDDDKVVLKFTDGTSTSADMVIGCDGIRSRTRKLVLGEQNPASSARYSHKYAIRGLVPMKSAIEALGEHKPSTRFMHIGPDAHMLTFPVAMGAFLNVVAFVSDAQEWPHENLTAKARKKDIVGNLANFGPTVRKIVELLPEELDQWAVFDTFDYPAETYAKGRVAIAGDAAHAAAPHHGAGAGFGIEDAAVLCSLIQVAEDALRSFPETKSKADVIQAALRTFDEVRRERCNWLLRSSRFVGELYEWQTHAGSDPEKCYKEAYERSHTIWDYDVEEMIRAAYEEFYRTLR